MTYVISYSYFCLKLCLAIQERQTKVEFGEKRLVPESGNNCHFWAFLALADSFRLCLPISTNKDYEYWPIYASISIVVCLENFIC